MTRLLGFMSELFLYFCAATFLTSLVGMAMLWQRGAFADGRMLRMWAALQGIETPRTTHKGEKAKSKEDSSEQPSFEEVLSKRALASLDLDLRASAINQSLGELQDIQAKIRTERSRFDSLVKSFDLKLQELESSATNQAVLETQQTLEALPPKQAKQQLLKLLAEKPRDKLPNPRESVVSLVKAMPIERRKKILAEFKSTDEEDKLSQILVDILSGAPDVPLLRQSRDDLQRVVPERK